MLVRNLDSAHPRAQARATTHTLAATTLLLATALLAILLTGPLWPLPTPTCLERPAASSLFSTDTATPARAAVVGENLRVSGGGAGMAASSRALLHGSMPTGTYPPCPRCKLIGLVGAWWFGHCASDGALFNCRRRAAPTTPGGPAGQNSTKFAQDLTSTAPFVACLSDADCSLPYAGFANVNRSIPLNTTGRLNAECALPEAPPNAPAAAFADLPGICLCKYLSPEATFEIVELAVVSQLGVALPPAAEAELDAGLETNFCFQRTPKGVNLSESHEVHPFFVPGNVIELPGVRNGGGGGGGAVVTDPVEFRAGVTVDVSVVDALSETYEEYGEEESGGDDVAERPAGGNDTFVVEMSAGGNGTAPGAGEGAGTGANRSAVVPPRGSNSSAPA